MNNKIVRDSYGNILSQEQIEYFKNSKVRNDKGNLLVVFHGTPKAIFNEFNPKETEGFKFDKNNVNYFTTNKNVAYSYSGTHDIIDRKSISPKGEAGIYALYINIEHPLIIDAKGNYWNRFEVNDSNKVKKDFLDKWENKRDKKISKEFINDLKNVNFEIKEDKYGDLGLFSGNYEIACCVEEVGEVIDEIIDDLKSDATIFKTTNDIVKEAIDSGNYDGVIFKNMIDSGGYGSDQSSDVYVTIESPNQIKSITNKKLSSANSILENKNSRLSNIEALFELDLLEENILTEDVHNTLNPLLFNSDMELKDEVKEKLNEIVTEFKNKLEEYNIKLNIKDVCLVGSNVNYNYNKNSDLDLHIVADSKDDCNENHLAVIYELYKKIFNDKYDIKIKDIPVELYIEMDEINANSNGIYSLNNGWIKKPKKEIVKEVNIDKEYNFWLNKYNKTIEKKNIEAIDNFIDSIYNLRQESIKKDGEFGKGNLVFKRFRNEELLDKIKRLKVDLESKKLTLEDFDYGTEDIQGKNVFDKNITGMTYYDQLLPSNPDYEYYSNKRNVESKIKYMTPERYYEYCARDIFNTSVDNLKNQRSVDLDYIEKLKTVITEKKKKFPITILDFNDKQQEGLHRMFVVGELFGWRNERFPVLCVYPKTEDLILKESKKRKSKKNKGFGWFSSLNPNAGNVEQNVAFFNNAMGSNISGSMGEDLEEEELDTIKEISDVLDNWAKFGFNNEIRPFKDYNIDDDLSGTFHQAFVELKYDKEENCFGFTFDFGTADKDKAIIDLSERLKKFNLIPEIKEDKILLKYNRQINEDINNQFELGSTVDFILTELKKQNIPFNFNYKDLFVFKNIDDMKNAEEIIKQKSDYILLPDLFATPAIQLGKINLYEHYDILGGNKVLENSLNDVIENFNKDIIYPKLVENKNIKCYTSAFFNTLVLTSWDTNEKFYLCFGYLQPENDNSDIIDNIISHSWIELSDGRIIETNKRSDLKRIPDNKLKFEFISDGDINKAINKIKEIIEKLK